MAWIKLATDVFEDDKIRLIECAPGGERVVLFWLKLLCLAGKQCPDGVLRMDGKVYTDAMLATVFRMSRASVTAALQTLAQYKMIRLQKNGIVIINWERHQRWEVYERRLEAGRRRQQAYRERLKQQKQSEYAQFMQKLGAERKEDNRGNAT